jgi:hypothetical protein
LAESYKKNEKTGRSAIGEIDKIQVWRLSCAIKLESKECGTFFN